MTASQGDDRIRTADGPEHAGLFQAGTDNSLATGLDHTRADKQMLTAELRVAHTLGISFKVISLIANLFDNFGIVRFDRA